MGWDCGAYEVASQSDRSNWLNLIQDARGGYVNCRTRFNYRSYWESSKITDSIYATGDLDKVVYGRSSTR